MTDDRNRDQPPARPSRRNQTDSTGNEAVSNEPGDIADDANRDDAAKPRPFPQDERSGAPPG